jgi:hypothetical protein
MNRCRWIQWAVALLPLIVLSQTENDYYSNLYQRCVANHEFLDLEDLRSVPCVACGNISTDTLTIAPDKEDRISVALFIEAQDDHHFPQAIAASLLTHSFRVTVLTSHEMPHNEKELAERILRYVPCDQQAMANSLLSIKTIQMVHSRPDCDYYGEILCHVPDRAWVHALYSAVQSIEHGLDVMLLEGTSIAALLVTEHFRIPSIAFVNDPAMLREMLGSTYRNRQISWTPIGWKRWLQNMFLNRWHNLAGTSQFMALNVLRRRLRMRPIRTVPDIWKAPASVIMTTLPAASVGQDSNLQSFTSPILPPCLPCWSTDEKVNDKPVIMVTTHGQPMSLANARYILKGLSLALRSLVEFRDDCDWEEEEPVHCWYREHEDFSIVWLPTEGATPDIMPDFVKVEHGSLLDSLARNTNPVAIVTQCVDESLWINGLGPPVLCWDQSSSPRDMALRLLQLLNKPPVKPAHQTRGDCLRRIVSLVESVANVKRNHGSGWYSVADMGRDLKYLHLREESITDNNGGWFVFAAWCILVSAVFYVIHEKTFPTHTSRLRRHRHHQRPTFTDIMDEMVFRLPELEQTWGIWIDWSKENLSDMEDSVPASAPPERADSKDGSHSTHSVRKRRPAKKRH